MLCFAVGALGVNLFIPRVISKATRWNVLDFPNHRKPHLKPTPRLGGLTLFPAVWFGISVAATFLVVGLPKDVKSIHEVLGLLLGITGMFLTGCLDDFRPLNAQKKLLGQILSAWIALYFLPLPTHILSFEVPTYFMRAIFLGWLILIPNSVNLLDGIDGLTSTLLAVFCGFIGVFSILRNELHWFLFAMPLMGGLFAFLRFNWQPAQIFLGDSGSLLLGFVVAYFSLIFSVSSQVDGQNWNPAISILLASVWLLDTGLAIFRRYKKNAPQLRILIKRSVGSYLALHWRALLSVLQPDQRHLHHSLIAAGFRIPAVCFILVCYAGFCFFAAAILSVSSSSESFGVRESVALAIVLISSTALYISYKGRWALHLQFKNGEKTSTEISSASSSKDLLNFEQKQLKKRPAA